MPHPGLRGTLIVALFGLAACAPASQPAAGVRPSATVATAPAAAPSPSPAPVASPTPDLGPTFVLLRAAEVTAGARLNFQGQGFRPGERAAVTVEDARGTPEATLDPVTVADDGHINEVSVPIPGGLTPGAHVLHVVGADSRRSARATFQLRLVPPTITMDTYSAKAAHTFGFSGSGFVPGEQVDVRLGGLGGAPLGSFVSDAQGEVVGHDVPLPLVQAGDYTLYFVGRQSGTPVSVTFSIQGFSPWTVLSNYSAAPYSVMGFSGEDFVPSEAIDVYLDRRGDQPVSQVAADGDGRFDVRAAFELPELAQGTHQVLFMARQSGAEVAAKFEVLPFGPGLELTDYAGRPGSPIGFIGSGWARSERLHAYVGQGRQEVATLQADPSGAFRTSASFRLPIGTVAGGVPITMRGEVSQAEVTLWYQALEMKATAELTAYEGPPGTVVSFTGRSFAGGERVHVHLGGRGGPDLGSAIADDEGTVDQVTTYPVAGQWGDVIPFVLVGEASHVEATTHFRIAPPAT